MLNFYHDCEDFTKKKEAEYWDADFLNKRREWKI